MAQKWSKIAIELQSVHSVAELLIYTLQQLGN